MKTALPPKPSGRQAAKKETAMQTTIGQHSFFAGFAGTRAAAELQKLLPPTLFMHDLHRNEKYAALPQALPADGEAVGRIGLAACRCSKAIPSWCFS